MTGLGLILLGLGLGCGGGDSPEDALVGTWFATTNAAQTRGLGLTFTSDGTFVVQDILVTSNTTAQDEIEKGTYSVSGKTLLFHPTQYSCPQADPPYSFEYTISGSTLTLIDPAAVISLAKDTTPPTGGSVIAIGCFQSDGSFVPSPLTPL